MKGIVPNRRKTDTSMYGPAHEIMLVIAYTQNLEQKPPLNVHIDVFIGAKSLYFVPSLQLHPYYVYASSEGSDESAHAQTRLSLFCATMRYAQKSHVLAFFYHLNLCNNILNRNFIVKQFVKLMVYYT